MLQKSITEHSVLTMEELEEIAFNNTVEDIDSVLTDLLLGNSMEHYLSATRFFRDLVNYNIKGLSSEEIKQHFGSMRFFEIIEDNLNSDDSVKRNDAAYTLGKVCAFTSIPKIKLALDKFISVDAEYADSLKFELEWLIESQKHA